MVRDWVEDQGRTAQTEIAKLLSGWSRCHAEKRRMGARPARGATRASIYWPGFVDAL